MATECIYPNADVSGDFTPVGAGSGMWGRINEGITCSGSIDESNYIHGADAQTCRLGFENPTFVGDSTSIAVRFRAKNDGTTNMYCTFYSNGVDADSSFRPLCGWSYETWTKNITIEKTAAELANMELYWYTTSTRYHDYVAEIEIEITYTPGAPPGDIVNQINIGDAWKDVTEMKVNVGDVWKDVPLGQINIGDAWKDLA